MNSRVSAAVLGLFALLLAGCGETMRGYLEKDTPAQTAATPQDLTMPPDLSLAQPGTAPAETQPVAPSSYENSDVAAPVPTAPAPSGAVSPDDKYRKAGISLNKPDGARKSSAELDAELKAYFVAQKRQQNPNYGTVFNMGNIFKDE